MKAKICGVTRPEDARLACELGAWAVGLVFAPKSPRRLTLEAAGAVRAAIAPGVLAVGVFEGNSPREVERALKELRLSAVQLHDGRAPKDAPVWRVIGPGERAPQGAAAILVEPKRSAVDRAAGRRVSDAQRREAWASAAGLKGAAPLIIVAGGLAPENVAEAARVSGADAVDVSSGVESAPGIKDPAKLRAFFEALSR